MLSARPAGLPLDTDRGILTRTPGRTLSKTRNVLQENATRIVPMTVVGKARKLVQSTPLQPRTLQTDRVLKDLPGKQVGPSKLKDAPAIRPLGDKTPFPNRTANQQPVSGAKIAKPALLDGSLRPSSARKHDRLPRSASKVFETPITNGQHWDVSDIEIQVDTPVANQSIQQESLDEIEYMPPKVEDFPYEPPFEMPNYREVGKTLMALIRSYTLEDDPPSTNISFTADPSENNFFALPTLPQQEIEDDGPFARAKPEPQVKPQPPTILKQRSAVTSKTVRPVTQRPAPTTRTPTANPPTVRRVPITLSTRPPTVTLQTSSSQPVTRAPTSRATTRAPSVSRSTPLVRVSTAQPCRTTSVSRSTIKPVVRPTSSTAAVKSKVAAPQQASITPAPRKLATPSNVPPNTARPRSGTITKEAFESNTHVVVHIRNNSLEDVKKDLEGLIVFEDAFDEEDGFRFDV